LWKVLEWKAVPAIDTLFGRTTTLVTARCQKSTLTNSPCHRLSIWPKTRAIMSTWPHHLMLVRALMRLRLLKGQHLFANFHSLLLARSMGSPANWMHIYSCWLTQCSLQTWLRTLWLDRHVWRSTKL
jgi:hypothetical protein